MVHKHVSNKTAHPVIPVQDLCLHVSAIEWLRYSYKNEDPSTYKGVSKFPGWQAGARTENGTPLCH